ncbi:MAG: hypothetical protein CW691_08175 [Candidatus Bathyarchaeum sp.]|nr:MAG: hypothetical protein CW691_08175 [Candidatus Bathyarchaeum sp.]
MEQLSFTNKKTGLFWKYKLRNCTYSKRCNPRFFVSLCGCGKSFGTTRLQLKCVAFWVLLVFLCLIWCGDGDFMHTPT